MKVWVIVPMDLLKILLSLLGEVFFIPVNDLFCMVNCLELAPSKVFRGFRLVAFHSRDIFTLTFIADAAPGESE